MRIDSATLEARLTALETQAATAARPQKYTPPFGYRLSGSRYSTLVEVDPDAAEIVRACFRLAAAGYSLKYMLGFLKDEGLLPYQGKVLGITGISNILNDPLYYGSVRQAQGEPIPSKHEAIISKELFEKVQEKLAERRYR